MSEIVVVVEEIDGITATVTPDSPISVITVAEQGPEGIPGPAGNPDPRFGDVVAGNYTEFDEVSGHQTMHGDARAWRDEVGDALSLRSQGPGVAANADAGVVEFASNANLLDFLYKNVQLNHDKDLAEPVMPHVHVLQNQDAVPNLLFRYRWIPTGTAPGAWTDVPMITQAIPYAGGVMSQILSLEDPIEPPAETDVSDIIQVKLIRDNANETGLFAGPDAYAGVLQVLSFDIHIHLNSIGSDLPYTK